MARASVGASEDDDDLDGSMCRCPDERMCGGEPLLAVVLAAVVLAVVDAKGENVDDLVEDRLVLDELG